MYDPAYEVCRYHLSARFGSQISDDDVIRIMETNVIPMPFYARPHREIEQVSCPQCGKMFTPKVGGGGRLQKFCSTECLQEYRTAHAKCNDPWQTDWTGRKLTDEQRAMMNILQRPLEPGEYAVRIGQGASDYRIMTKEDKGRFTHNANRKYKMVEDGNFHAHMELNPEHHAVGICECCGKVFKLRPGNADNRYCSSTCRTTMNRLESINAHTIHMNGRDYVKDPNNPNANNSGLVAESVLAAQKKLGRPLEPGEVVHHIDENPKNNSPENLIVFVSQQYHQQWHRRGDLGCRLLQNPDGSYYTMKRKQVVDIVPPEKRSICQPI